ncbi:MAG: hypothetical protein ACRDJC_05895 [Thermomicrobiales bacterium]
MRWLSGRFLTVMAMAMVLLIGAAAFVAQPRVIAQEATPEAGEGMPEDVSFEPITFALGVDLASPADLSIARIGLEPGASFPIVASDPNDGILIVESGLITVEMAGPVTVTRGATLGEALAAAESTGDFGAVLETYDVGETVVLEAGDAIFIPGSLNGEIRNDERVRAETLAFLVSPSGAMMPEASPPEATPAP